jgi:hypothetical protein
LPVDSTTVLSILPFVFSGAPLKNKSAGLGHSHTTLSTYHSSGAEPRLRMVKRLRQFRDECQQAARGAGAKSAEGSLQKKWELLGSSSPQVIWATGQISSFDNNPALTALHPHGGRATVE